MGVLAYATWCIVLAATIAHLVIGTMLQRFVPNLRAAGEHDEPGRMSSPVNMAGAQSITRSDRTSRLPRQRRRYAWHRVQLCLQMVSKSQCERDDGKCRVCVTARDKDR
jgi:5-methylcytosine-specific restriction endonuclease McrA